MTTTNQPLVKKNGSAPFDSLDELMAVHAQLLAQTPMESLDRDQVERVRDFLKRGAATGRRLDAPSSRQEAQRLLNYWSATLYSEAAAATEREHGASKELDVPSALLADFDEAAARELIQSGDALLEALSPEERVAARKILLRLVRLEPQGDQLVPARIHRSDLDLDRIPHASGVLDKLVAGRIVVVSQEPSHGDAILELASPTLANHWSQLGEWLQDRKKFRAAASRWIEGSSSRETGLTLGRLRDAFAYVDLNRDEQCYFSEAGGELLRRRLLQMTGLVALLGTLLLGAAIMVPMYLYHAHLQEDKEKDKHWEESKKTAIETARRLEAERSATSEKQLRTLAESAQKQAEERSQQLGSYLQDMLDLKEAYGIFKKDQIQGFRDKLNAIRAQQSLASNRGVVRPVRPGVSLGLATRGGGASAGVIVRDSQQKTYILTVRPVLDGNRGDVVIQPMDIDGGSEANRVATLAKVTGSTPMAPEAVALAELDPKIAASNEIPTVGKIRGIAQSVRAGEKVLLIGRSSGLAHGALERVENDQIVMACVSHVGDAGGPVLNEKNELIGLYRASNQARTESYVIPIRPVLESLSLTLLP
jgi:hypothetical protein